MSLSPAARRRRALLAAARVTLSLSALGCGPPSGEPAAVSGSACNTKLRDTYPDDALACCRPAIGELDALTRAAFAPSNAAYSGRYVQLPTPTPLQRDCCALAIDVLDKAPAPTDGYATPEASCCLYVESPAGGRPPGPFCGPGRKPLP